MNFEENRLRTFNNWPNDAAVDHLRIARAGFFSTHQGLEVECFACQLKISQWNYGDQVMERHRTLSPECPFVLNPCTSGNIPIIPRNSVSVNFSNQEESLAIRLATFQNWPIPHIVTPESLANAGFYYLKEGDNTKCSFCNGVVRAWVPGDDPDLEHQRHFPNCPYVINFINPRLRRANNSSNNSSVGLDLFSNVTVLGDQQSFNELGVQIHKSSKRLDYATVEARLRSFESWSTDLIQTPEVLSQAGFYYEGTGDQVRCFYCEGGLRHWDPHDDPWTEHAKWFPSCSFVIHAKGQDFVTACIQGLTGHVRPPPPQKDAASNGREVTDREVQEQLSSPLVTAALAIGIKEQQVKRAIKERLKQTGKPFGFADALVEAALNYPEDNPAGDNSSNSSERNSGQGNSTPQPGTQTEARESPTAQNAPTSTSSKNNKPSESSSSSSTKECPPAESTVSLEEENRIIQEAHLCRICMNAEMGILFLPCGHLATCVNCAFNLEDCPVCRCDIKATVRAFFS